MFIDNIGRVDIKFQLLGRDIRLHNRFQIMHNLRQRSFLFFDFYFAALNIVDMMGGTITVASEEGKGTTFTVALQFKTCSGPVRQEGSPLKLLRHCP